jgi:hypothetical protein
MTILNCLETNSQGSTLSYPKGKCEMTSNVAFKQPQATPKGFCEAIACATLGQH